MTALHFAQSGLNTLLVSMDPAHNQRDLFEADFCEKPRKVVKSLEVKEVDTGFWIAKYLAETREQLRKSYLYQSAFNLQTHFKVLQYSPGLEEYALLMAFESTLRRQADKDVIVFDMAPTALSLRFFSLPGITLVWLEELLKLRNLICEKKEIISSIRLGSREIEQDRIKARIKTLTDRQVRLRDCFADHRTHVHLVMNADRLSLSEALRIRRVLADISIPIDRAVVNKVKPEDSMTAITSEFDPRSVSVLPLADCDLIGVQALQRYVMHHENLFPEMSPLGRLNHCVSS